MSIDTGVNGVDVSEGQRRIDSLRFVRGTGTCQTTIHVAIQRLGVLLSCHPKSRTERKKTDQPTNPNRAGVRGVRDRPTDCGGGEGQRLPNM